VRRGAVRPPTPSNGAPTSSSTPALQARKNPELYTLTQELPQQQQQQQHASQQLPQQQQHQGSSVAQKAVATPGVAAAPWNLSSVQGSVGSTGAYSSEPQPPQQQQQQQPLSSSSSSSQQLLLRHKPEVLAPAGGWPQLRSAVENGADAVYFGVTGFNARAR
jgi:hypothetical protein